MNPPAGPAVLIVSEDDEMSTAMEQLGRSATHCEGPGGSTCPIVETGECSMVDTASGVVFELDLDDPYNAEILRCYRRTLGPLVPIVVITDAEDRTTNGLEGIATVPELDTDDLSVFVDRVELAAMARQALSDLAGAGSSRTGRRAGL